MAASTEVRVPLLDDELVRLSGAIPPGLKLRRTTRKYAFKRSMEGVLPHEIIWRPKAGFTAPVRAWLTGELAPMVDDLLSPAQIRRRGLLNAPEVERIVRANAERHRGQRTADLGAADARTLAAGVLGMRLGTRRVIRALLLIGLGVTLARGAAARLRHLRRRPTTPARLRHFRRRPTTPPSLYRAAQGMRPGSNRLTSQACSPRTPSGTGLTWPPSRSAISGWLRNSPRRRRVRSSPALDHGSRQARTAPRSTSWDRSSGACRCTSMSLRRTVRRSAMHSSACRCRPTLVRRPDPTRT